MREKLPSRRVRAASIALAALAFAAAADASRVGSGAPAASSAGVQPGATQPAHVQADESASLRQGTIGALDSRAGLRVQVQGVWLDAIAGTTQVIRNGSPAALDTLKAGEAIRFTVAPASAGAAPALKVIYAP
jgi:hypothetical protein